MTIRVKNILLPHVHECPDCHEMWDCFVEDCLTDLSKQCPDCCMQLRLLERNN